MEARFDWYQGTVQGTVSDLLSGLAESVAGLGREVETLERVPYGYEWGSRIKDSGGPVASVWWGTKHVHPHVVASGESAPAVAAFLRSAYAGLHGVSRADPCIDYGEEGAYDRLQGIALDVARDRGVKVGTAGDHLLTMKGRTMYVGAPTSHAMCRIYDKAAELRHKFQNDPVALLALPEHLARFEGQIRPKTGEAKLAAAKATPLELMGSAAWMRDLVQRVEGIELQPFQAGRVWRQSDDKRAYDGMLAQYGAVLRRMVGDAGSWDCVGLQIGEDLETMEIAKRRMRRG